MDISKQITQHFDLEIAGFYNIEKIKSPGLTPLQKFIKKLKARRYNKIWSERHKNDPKLIERRKRQFALLKAMNYNRNDGNRIRHHNVAKSSSVKANKQLDYEFFMEHTDDILSATGKELADLVENLSIDSKLPISEQQEQVLEKLSKKCLPNEKEWSPDYIRRMKEKFLETLENTHFPLMACKILQLKTSIFRTWLQTDQEFANNFYDIQARMGERVGHAMLAKAIEGDLGALMFVLKQFGDSVSFIEPKVTATSQVSVDASTVSGLTAEEQETLLSLMRKAQQGVSQEKSTVFIEYDEEKPDNSKLISHEFDESEIKDDEVIDVNPHENTIIPNIIDYQGD